MKNLATILVLSLALIVPVATATDPWDLGGGDDHSGTDNELVPGVVQQHDLEAVGGVADEDWYLLSQKPYSSYEIVVDGLTEPVSTLPWNDTNQLLRLSLVASNENVFASAVGTSTIGSSRSLRVRNTTASEVTDQFVMVRSGSGGCFTSCTATASYRISMRETTMFASRFNNSATQITVLILQNTHNATAFYTAHFFNAAGTHLDSTGGSLLAHGSVAINTSTIPQLVGMSGSIIVNHNAPYTALTGKAVALEPSTGFSFDTPLVPKLH